jgi:hypothetical protein
VGGSVRSIERVPCWEEIWVLDWVEDSVEDCFEDWVDA